ncbi:Na+/H+ antiporter NhaC family protein [Candidatus Marinimicrobia bacterium MT.SAG.3]|nr:Na+/H+ antiporter NhaC family protein [Candidatus Marinimicrobia bacterium MT.SAG.3]
MFLRNITFICALLLVWSLSVKATSTPYHISIDSRKIVLKGVPFSFTVNILSSNGEIDHGARGVIELYGFKIVGADGILRPPEEVETRSGTITIDNAVFLSAGQNKISVEFGNARASKTIPTLPGILSLAPPLIAIGLAVLFKEVLLSLFAGIWIGAVFLAGYNPISGFLVAIDKYIVPSLANKDHAAVILFSMGLGGMVGLIARNGGMHGVVEKISKYAKSARSGQIATLSMGLLIFFDDYANTLLVGNTMRPFTDKLKISREKLSFLVDATAAPIASIAFVSTWIGFQNGLIKQGFDAVNLDMDPYVAFISSIPYSFYAFIMLGLIVITATRARDFGPMLTAERRAQQTGKVIRDGAKPLAGADLSELELPENLDKRWYNAMIPIGFVIVTTIVGLYFNGRAALGASAETMAFHEIIGNANSFTVLMWAAFGGSILAGIMSLSQKLMNLQETVDAYLNGIKSMVYAMVILVLAWSLGAIAADLSTADYVLHITRGLFSPNLLPAMTFIVAALIGFSTGTSWGTMAILTPIVIPMAYHLPIEAGIDASLQSTILLGTIAAVLSGACFGDHCSPISDTTILSSMASGADHIDHVKTQLPYAFLAAGVAVVFGYIPAGYGMNPYLSIVLGIGALYLIHWKISKPVIVT